MSNFYQDWKVVVLKKNDPTKEKEKEKIKHVSNRVATTNGNSAVKVYDPDNPDKEPEYKPKLVDSQFAMQIQKARTMKKMTQKELASALSIPFDIINKYEKGTGIHNPSYVSKIKRYLGIDKNFRI